MAVIDIRQNVHGSIAVRDPHRAQPMRPWLVVYVAAGDSRHAVFDGQTLPDQAVAGWTRLLPVAEARLTSRPGVAGAEIDSVPLICEADGCTRHPGHEPPHVVREGAVTRRWREGHPRIVAVPYVPGEGCDCPPPWGGVVRTNPDCVEHGGDAR